MNESEVHHPAEQTGRRFPKPIGCLLLVLVCSAGAVWILRDPLPELDAEQLREARQRWQQWGPSTYQMEVQVSGRQAATYELEVVDHEVISALHNGRPLRRQRALHAWSVPGMFDTIEADLRMQQRVQSHPDPGTSELRLQCKFDPHYGYPARYRRTEFRRQGPNFVVSWEVTAFERPEVPVPVN